MDALQRQVLRIIGARPRISTKAQPDADLARLSRLVDESGLVAWATSGENPIWREGREEASGIEAKRCSMTVDEVVHDFDAFILSGITIELLCFLKTVPPTDAENLICWMLQQDDLIPDGSLCYKGYPERTEQMYRTALRAGLRRPDPSEPKWFIKACIAHKGALAVFRDLAAVVDSDNESEKDRAGALQAMYWAGADQWPSLRRYDEYKASPQETARKWNADFLHSLDARGLTASVGLDSAHSREDLLRSKPRHFQWWDTLVRDDVVEAERVWRLLIRRCIAIILDEQRSHALRKQAFFQIPRVPGTDRHELLDADGRRQLDQVQQLAAVFPDEQVQRVLSPQAGTGNEASPMSTTQPLERSTRLAVLLRGVKQALFRWWR